jgi:hypothetical protein
MSIHARPLGGRVFFAGEATEPVEYGTVHAACGRPSRLPRRCSGLATGVDASRAMRPWAGARRGAGPAQWLIDRVPIGRAQDEGLANKILFVLVIVSGLATLGVLFAG